MMREGEQKMYRFVFGIVLVSHGLAHIFDLIALLTTGGVGNADKPGVASSRLVLSTTRSRAIAFLWLAAAWTLTGAGVGIFLQKGWWTSIAVIGAMLSIAANISWWNRTRRSAKLGAILDVIIIVGLLTPLKEKIIELIG
jgi:uncharacterized membrane protein YphA (DoxX/SURF4 family)